MQSSPAAVRDLLSNQGARNKLVTPRIARRQELFADGYDGYDGTNNPDMDSLSIYVLYVLLCRPKERI